MVVTKKKVAKKSRGIRKTTSIPVESLPSSRLSSLRRPAMLVLIILILGLLAYRYKHLFVVAVVDNQPITRYTLDRQLEKQGGKSVLDNEIDRRLILSELRQRNLAVTDQDVDTKIKEIENDLKDRGADLDNLLSLQGQTRETIKDQIRTELSVEKLLAGDISVSEEEIKTYFDQNKTLFAAGQKLDDVRAQIGQQLFQQKLSEKFTPWLTDLRAKAKIHYFLTF